MSSTTFVSSSTSSGPGDERLRGVDAWRGAAVLLTVLDHVLVVALDLGAPAALGWVRVTVTRAALPMFAGATGWLLAWRGRPAPASRWAAVVGFGAALTVPAAWSGLYGVPDVLVVLALVAGLHGRILRRPVWWAGVAALAATQQWWARLGVWSGYDPAVVALWTALGVLAWSRPSAWQTGRQGAAWLAWIGRRPLAAYVFHLVALYALWWAAQWWPGRWW